MAVFAGQPARPTASRLPIAIPTHPRLLHLPPAMGRWVSPFGVQRVVLGQSRMAIGCTQRCLLAVPTSARLPGYPLWGPDNRPHPGLNRPAPFRRLSDLDLGRRPGLLG